MEPEGSLPQSQVPATCPYPEPAWSSPYPQILHLYSNNNRNIFYLMTLSFVKII